MRAGIASRRRATRALVGLVLACLAAAGAAGIGAGSVQAMQWGGDDGAAPGAEQVCTESRRGGRSASFGWPVKPFHRQHPVRGYFGDPRIGGHGGTSFHFGVDVSAPDGTAVYATTSGRIGLSGKHRGSVYIIRGDRTVFSYWHIAPAVQAGDYAVAYRTVLGHIVEGWGHVHFAERRPSGYVNPLRPGAMGPYADRTCPQVTGVVFERGGTPVAADVLHGSFDVVVEALDLPAVSAPDPWRDLPITPALVRWRILDGQGNTVTRWRAAFDVRATLPSASFDEVYAIGTRQNHPNRPGLYRFRLAAGWDSTAVRNGAYTLQVAAVDSRGNRTRGASSFTVAN